MFHSARIKLTIWYLLIIMAISLAFSAIIYQVTMREVYRFAAEQRHRIEQSLKENNYYLPDRQGRVRSFILIDDNELIEEVRRRTLISLGIINSVILLTAGGLGYFLAGRTLLPIAEMVDEQNRFISDASHELKTPLTSLKSTFEVFLRDKKPSFSDAKEIIAESVEEVNKLQKLSEGLLSLAHLKNHQNPLHIININLKTHIEKAVKRIAPLAQTNHIAIKKNIGSIELQADPDSLSEVWTILLDNAIKYSPNTSTINVSAKKSKNCVLITVEDQGIGIAQKDLEHIFDRFYRADSARIKTGANGFGLGLSIAKKIIEAHHGTIYAQSGRKAGTTIVVKLPLKQGR